MHVLEHNCCRESYVYSQDALHASNVQQAVRYGTAAPQRVNVSPAEAVAIQA